MYQEENVLCGSSAYTKKYYLNESFEMLPEGIKDELKIMCVLFTEDIGGTLTCFLTKTAGSSSRQGRTKGICSMTRLGASLR